jgi:hypothetical protein
MIHRPLELGAPGDMVLEGLETEAREAGKGCGLIRNRCRRGREETALGGDSEMRPEYPHIPQQLLEYRSPKLVEVFNHQGEAKTWQAIDDLFRIVSEITLLKPDDLLPRLAFDAKNLDRYSLQSLLGVMRTVVTLQNLGFVEITPLPPRQDRKEADLLAKRKGDLFAVEVFRANEDRWRYPGYNLEEYIGRRFVEDKKPQLEATMSSYGCSKAILVVVFDSESKALLSKSELQVAAECSYISMDFPDKTHLIMFTGVSDAVTGEDDLAIFPEFLP